MKNTQKKERTQQPSKSSLCQNDSYIITQYQQKNNRRVRYGK